MGCEEENALRYASGYVALKTMRELKKKKGKKASKFVDCLSNMAVIGNETSFYAYILLSGLRVWIEVSVSMMPAFVCSDLLNVLNN